MGSTRNRTARPVPVPVIIGFVGLLTATLVGLVVVRSRGDDGPTPRTGGPAGTTGPDPADRTGSVEMPGAADVRPVEPPPAYGARWTVTDSAGDVRVEERIVVRPFDGVARSLRDGVVTAERRSELGRLHILANDAWTTLESSPALAAGDLRPWIALDDLVAAGRIQRREVREVSGLRCQVHRFGEPVTSGLVVAHDPGAPGFADVCVTGEGLVAEQLWVDGDRLLERWLLDEVTFSDPTELAGEVTPPGRTTVLAPTAGGGSFRDVTDDSTLGGVTVVVSPPERFRHLGRWAFVEPKLEAPGAETSPDRGRVAGITDVWVDGPDTIVLSQGEARDGAAPFQPHPDGRPVELGLLDLGEAFWDLRGNEVRTRFPDGRFVRLWGTVPLDGLIGLLRGAEVVEGGGITFTDGPG